MTSNGSCQFPGIRFQGGYAFWMTACKQLTSVFVVFSILFCMTLSMAHAEYAYRKAITIGHSKVSGSSPLSNFPVLISIASDNDLRTSVNGGHLQNSNGYDFEFRASDGSARLNHEVEHYIAATGQLIAWVNIPVLSPEIDTVIYLHYGDGTLTTSTEHPTAVWDGNYVGVWHLGESGSGISGEFADSTWNHNDGQGGGTVPAKVDGKIGKAQSFDGVGDYISVPNSATLQLSGAMTIEAWIKLDAFGSGGEVDVIARKGENNPNNYQLAIQDSQATLGLDENDDGGLSGPAVLSSGLWYHVVGSWDGSTRTVYINGAEAISSPSTGTIGSDTRPLYMGGRPGADLTDGIVDEVRISKVARTSDWIKTEYNNQKSPDTFYTLGAEESIAGLILYQITALAGSNGSISPYGIVSVQSGSQETFTITADPGYEVQDVRVDGTSVILTDGQYTFAGIDGNHQIEALFAPSQSGSSGTNSSEGVSIPGCAMNIHIPYSSTGFNPDDFSFINTEVTANNTLLLNTGYWAVDPNQVVIPFTQEVTATFFYEGAGYRGNDFGWLLAAEGINGTRHEIYRNINDNNNNGVLDDRDWPGANADDLFVNLVNLGTFAGGTELVFYLKAQANIYDGPAAGHTYFTKTEWNPDTYTSWKDECTADQFTKIYHLGGNNNSEGQCLLESNWMTASAVSRLNDVFGLDFQDASSSLQITRNEKFSHVIVGVPENKPNEWILGWEDLWGAGDTDHNDLIFHIERQTGGVVELTAPLTPDQAGSYYTGLTLSVYDHMPCPGMTDVVYHVSIDNGANWVEINDWDEVWQTDAGKNKLSQVDSWSPGDPAYTYRSVRVDFAGRGITGRQLVWKTALKSDQQGCEPEILDIILDADVATHGTFSRSSPVVKSNVIYSGFYETPASSWRDKSLRGHLTATRLYDPTNPNATSEQFLWDAGEVLSRTDPGSRTIYFPEISVGQVVNREVAVGDGDTRTFSGRLDPSPVTATTLMITDGRETFRDKHTDVLLGSLGGSGTINRFTGEFTLTFHEAPIESASIRASYQHYTASGAPLVFAAANVTKAILSLDDTEIIPDGYIYDFDNDSDVDDNDAHWLMNWVKGYELGTTVARDWLLAPIDHSVPAVATPPGIPSWYFGTATTSEELAGYDQFRQAYADRRTVVYAGSRSGMLHAFDAGAFRNGNNPKTDGYGVTENRGYFSWEDLSATNPLYCNGDYTDCPDYGSGQELWAFIPANLLARLKNNLLARLNKERLTDYDQAYVDASPALADVYINGSWRTVLLSAEGNGGDTVFCLDVTDPRQPPTFMWEFADPDLYRSRSSPSVAKIGRILQSGSARWVAFFISGLDQRYDRTQYPSVYMIDIASGSVVERIFLTAEANGIGGVPSGQPTIVDSDGNGYIDRFYIGTDKGFLYKVNIPDEPDTVKYTISHCVINTAFTDDDFNEVDPQWHYQPIYGSPVAVVDNSISSTGSLDYNIRLFFGTGDSPYYAEDTNIEGTRYHFFAYQDQAEKGVCDNESVFLDWFYELPEGHRVFASAFASAGTIYFGTSTATTEDPCDGGGLVSSNQGKIFAFDMNGPNDLGEPKFEQTVGNIVVSPLVEDQHLYIKSQSTGLQSFGTGVYNNRTIIGGRPQVEVRMWRELF